MKLQKIKVLIWDKLDNTEFIFIFRSINEFLTVCKSTGHLV